MVGAVFALVSMTGCAEQSVRARAETDLHCTSEPIRVVEMADGYHAYGCGDHAVYDVVNYHRHAIVRTD